MQPMPAEQLQLYNFVLFCFVREMMDSAFCKYSGQYQEGEFHLQQSSFQIT